MEGIAHFRVTAIPAVWNLTETWPVELREYIGANCFAVDVRRTMITIFLTNDSFLVADLVRRVMATEGATKEITDYGNLNFDFPGDPDIRFVV